MAGSVNFCVLVGHIGRDPEVKEFSNGGRIANFSIATSDSWKDKTTGERKERTEWHNISVKSDGLVGVVERYLHKGSKVYVKGALQTRSYEKDGTQRSITEVVLSGFDSQLVMLDGKEAGGQDKRFEDPYSPTGKPLGSPQNQRRVVDDLDSDVPF